MNRDALVVGVVALAILLMLVADAAVRAYRRRLKEERRLGRLESLAWAAKTTRRESV